MCGVLNHRHKLGPIPKIITDTQHSTLRIHTPHSRFPHSNTLSVKCGVLSIRHKSGARIHEKHKDRWTLCLYNVTGLEVMSLTSEWQTYQCGSTVKEQSFRPNYRHQCKNDPIRTMHWRILCLVLFKLWSHSRDLFHIPF